MSNCPECGREAKQKIKTTCRACYQKRRYAGRPKAVCHPDRKDHAGGFCRSCYRKGERSPRCPNHPDRGSVARGLCQFCYNREPDVRERIVQSRRLRKYGLSKESYLDLVETQKNQCAICGREPSVIDHSHKSQKVRGLLCFNCNVLLGNARDSVGILKAAVAYLEKHNGR